MLYHIPRNLSLIIELPTIFRAVHLQVALCDFITKPSQFFSQLECLCSRFDDFMILRCRLGFQLFVLLSKLGDGTVILFQKWNGNNIRGIFSFISLGNSSVKDICGFLQFKLWEHLCTERRRLWLSSRVDTCSLFELKWLHSFVSWRFIRQIPIDNRLMMPDF